MRRWSTLVAAGAAGLLFVWGCGDTDEISSLAVVADDSGPTPNAPDSSRSIADDAAGMDVSKPTDASTFVDAGTDTGVDADAASEPVDAGVDAHEDAGADADASDDASEPVDAGTDAAPTVDSGTDAGPPPVCTNGETRCHAYQTQRCTNDTWVRQSGQDCCYDARFSVSGTKVTDANTGKVWYRYGGHGAGGGSLCPAVIPNGRLPTTAELMAITIGPPVNNVSVCSPMVDQKAFKGVYAGDTQTSDGCVDLIRGISKVACTEDTPGFLCVAD